MDIQSVLEDLTSEDRRATALLRREHEVILAAFRQYHDAACGPRSPREAIAQEIGSLLEMHDRVERAVVYPALAPYHGPLIRAFMAEHDELAACIGRIRTARDGPERLFARVDRLEQMARVHIAQEESSLLAAVEHDQPRLNAALYGSIVREKERLAGTVAELESRS